MHANLQRDRLIPSWCVAYFVIDRIYCVTLKMQHQEGVAKNLYKVQGKCTTASYANDVKCVGLQLTWTELKGTEPAERAIVAP